MNTELMTAMREHTVTVTPWTGDEYTVMVNADSEYTAAARVIRSIDVKWVAVGTVCACLDGSGNIGWGKLSGVSK
jgi:hypothetical protein